MVVTTTVSGYSTTRTDGKYDAGGNLTSTAVTDSLGGSAALVSATATYDAAGRLAMASYGNGMSLAATYTPYETLASYSWTESRRQRLDVVEQL